MLHLSHTNAQWSLLIGRVLIGALFLMAGVQKLMGGTEGLGGYIASGMPFIPAGMLTVVAILVIAIEIVGGALLILGYFTRKAACGLTLFTLIATVFFHPGWSQPDQMTMMLKNLAIVGGLLAYGAVGPGSLSLDTKVRGHRPLEPACPAHSNNMPSTPGGM